MDRELDEELRFHLESQIDEYITSGMTPEEARRRALRRFGSMPLAKDRTRDTRVLAWLDSFRRDLIPGARMGSVGAERIGQSPDIIGRVVSACIWTAKTWRIKESILAACLFSKEGKRK